MLKDLKENLITETDWGWVSWCFYLVHAIRLWLSEISLTKKFFKNTLKRNFKLKDFNTAQKNSGASIFSFRFAFISFSSTKSAIYEIKRFCTHHSCTSHNGDQNSSFNCIAYPQPWWQEMAMFVWHFFHSFQTSVFLLWKYFCFLCKLKSNSIGIEKETKICAVLQEKRKCSVASRLLWVRETKSHPKIAQFIQT